MSSSSRRFILVLLCSTLPVAGCGSDSAAGSGGGCSAPQILSEQESAAPGAELAIRGETFMDGCVDGAANGTPYGTASPHTSVAIVVMQADEIVVETEAAPDSAGSFDLTLELPDDLGSEPIMITAPDIVGAESLTLPVEERDG